VLSKEKRARLAEVMALREEAAIGVGASAPSAPNVVLAAPSLAPSAPLVAVPLAAVTASPPPAPLEKGKRVVEIVSDDDADTMEGPTFKRRSVVVAATSHSSSSRRFSSFRDHPPSTSSLELPLVVQQILKGYQKGAMESLSEMAVRESLTLSLSEFFAQSDALSHEMESKAKEQLALVEVKAAEELALAKEQLAQQACVFSNRETVLHQEVSALHQDDLETKKKLFDKSQE